MLFLKSSRVLMLTAALFARSWTASAAPVDSVPPLPAPTGTVVNVSTISQLRTALANLQSNTTIVLAPGTYTLTDALWINGTYSNIGLRGATNNRDDVVLAGGGMSNAAVPHGIWTGGNIQGLTIANLTIRDVYYHALNFNAGTQSPRVYNVRIANAGEQLLKANPNGSGGVNNGIVEYSIIEYSTTSKTDYTNGVDVHTGANWIIRHNLFRNIKAPAGGAIAGPAVLMWNGSSNSVVEGNTFVNCQREIAMGLIDRGASANDHNGGVVRNNFIYRASGLASDAAILVNDSPSTQVLHNTILVSGTYSQPIEYRFSGSTGVVIRNNLVDGNVVARDGASASVSGNVTASAALFVNPAAGDLHLKSTATAAIDKASSAGVTNDYDGQARPSGSAPDVGADEFAGSTTTTPPPPAAPTNLRIIR